MVGLSSVPGLVIAPFKADTSSKFQHQRPIRHSSSTIGHEDAGCYNVQGENGTFIIRPRTNAQLPLYVSASICQSVWFPGRRGGISIRHPYELGSMGSKDKCSQGSYRRFSQPHSETAILLGLTISGIRGFHNTGAHAILGIVIFISNTNLQVMLPR